LFGSPTVSPLGAGSFLPRPCLTFPLENTNRLFFFSFGFRDSLSSYIIKFVPLLCSFPLQDLPGKEQLFFSTKRAFSDQEGYKSFPLLRFFCFFFLMRYPFYKLFFRGWDAFPPGRLAPPPPGPRKRNSSFFFSPPIYLCFPGTSREQDSANFSQKSESVFFSDTPDFFFSMFPTVFFFQRPPEPWMGLFFLFQ